MTDFYATSRSNYVLVKDVTAAIESLKGFDISVHRHPTNENAIMLAGCDADGTFSFSYTDEETGGETYLDLDLAKWASTNPAEGQVLVLVSAGAEKLRYMSAWAQAYTWKGKSFSVDMAWCTVQQGLRKLDLGEIEVADPSYTNLNEGASS